MRNKNRFFIVVLLLLMFLMGCTNNSKTTNESKKEDTKTENNEETKKENSKTEVKDGKYTGTSPGMQGNITSEITVENGEIVKIDFIENTETPAITKVAFERIPKQIIENQSLNLDSVTGATISSRAILRSVEKAATEANLDIKSLKEKVIESTKKDPIELHTDVLVLGGGGAGFSSAITAAQEGAKVVILEKSSFLGGNTLLAGDAINAVDEEAQSKMILTESQKTALDNYLKLEESNPELKFDKFPEYKEVLSKLQAEIKEYYANNEGKTPGKDMPGFDSVSLHIWQSYSGGLRELSDGTWVAPNLKLLTKVAEEAFNSIKWMDEIGLEPLYGANAESKNGKGLYTVLGAMWPRTHSFIAGDKRIDVLLKAAEEKGVEVYTETKATELIIDDSGRVVGAKAIKADGTEMTIHAKNGVVIATGGYCANPKMVKELDKYWGDDLTDTTLTTNVGTNQGDGIIMAQKVGADTVDMGVTQLMPSSSPIKGTMTDGIWADAGSQIWIDKKGDRFVNEYAERDVLAKGSLAQEDGIFYIIYAGISDGSANKLKGATLEDQLFGNKVQNMVDTGNVWYGETLKDLVEATKKSAGGAQPEFTEEKLRETIEKYNSYAEKQEDKDFGKEVIQGAIDLDYIDKTEGFGIVISPRKASLHHTMGGLKIDEQAHVLNKEGNIIPGLYAAGEVTGGIHAGNRLGGNAIADIFTFGRIAGENAAKNK